MRLLFPLLFAVALLMSGCGPSSTATVNIPVPSDGHLPTGQHLRTVFLILMENHNWSSIAGNPDASYINHTLLPQASYATQYYNPPNLHPSEPNYLWLEAGTNCFSDTGCIRDDGPPSAHATHTRQHLVDLLQRAGISWRAYAENISGASCPLDQNTALADGAENSVPGLSGYLYAAKHNPFVYFDDVTGNLNPHASRCVTHIRPFTQFGTDLQHGHVAQYNFVVPNLCDDMHSGCPALSNTVKQGDVWLRRVIPAIQRSSAYRDGGVIFITWDEGEGGDGPIGLIALSPDARGHGYHNAIHYTHSSTLRTVEEIFHVHPFLGGAAHAPDLRNLFRQFP